MNGSRIVSIPPWLFKESVSRWSLTCTMIGCGLRFRLDKWQHSTREGFVRRCPWSDCNKASRNRRNIIHRKNNLKSHRAQWYNFQVFLVFLYCLIYKNTVFLVISREWCHKGNGLYGNSLTDKRSIWFSQQTILLSASGKTLCRWRKKGSRTCSDM